MIRPARGLLLLPRDLERPARDSYELIILDAGCSGLSLCYYLLEERVDAPILVLDRKRTFEDDRIWCFWEVEPTPFTHLTLKEWRSWSFASEGGRVTQTTNRYPYKFVAALALLLGLYLMVPEASATPPALLALYLVLVSALTLPHVVVVSLMGVRQGLWRDSRQLSASSHQQKSSN